MCAKPIYISEESSFVFCNIIKYKWWYNIEQRCNIYPVWDMILELEMKMSPSNWLLFPALASHLVKLCINLFISEFNDIKRSHELPSSWSGGRDGKRWVTKVQQLYHQDFLSNSRDLTMWNSRRYCLVLWIALLGIFSTKIVTKVIQTYLA